MRHFRQPVVNWCTFRPFYQPVIPWWTFRHFLPACYTLVDLQAIFTSLLYPGGPSDHFHQPVIPTLVNLQTIFTSLLLIDRKYFIHTQ